jgi:hypothetical protein
MSPTPLESRALDGRDEARVSCTAVVLEHELKMLQASEHVVDALIDERTLARSPL